MTPTSTGIFPNVSRDTYDRIERVNWSRLQHLRRSPAHFRATGLIEEEDTDAMRLGRAVHMATLEPEKFRSSHAVWDGGRRYGKEWDAFQKANAGVEILTADQYQQVQALSTAALTNEHAARYLRGGQAELTVLWTDHGEEYDTECKGRVDFVQDGGALVDLKTTRDASPEAFCRQAWSLGFLGQAAFYVDGYAAAHGGELLPYVIVAVEKDPPYVVQLYRVPERLLELGRDIYRGLLERLAACRLSNSWPGYADGLLDLTVPRWAVPQNDDTDLNGLQLVVNQ